MTRQPVRRWRITTAAATAIVGTLGASSPTQADVLYTLQNLRHAPAPSYDTAAGRPGVTASRPAHNALNNLGDITGSGYTGGYSRPYYYRHSSGTLANLGDTTGDFGDPAASDANGSSTGLGINDQGWVVGRSSTASGFSSTWRPFVWADLDGNGARNGSEMVELPANPGATSGVASAINNAGQALIEGSSGLYRAQFQITGGTVQEVGTRVQVFAGDPNAAAINAAGDVGYTSGDQGYVWRDLNTNNQADANETYAIAAMSDWFPRTRVYGINDNGQVVGTMRNDNSKDVGFVWTDLNADNVMDWDDADNDGVFDADETSEEIARFTADPAGIGGSEGNLFARSMNNLGQVVGGYATADRYAFVWDAEHGVRNLNDLIDPALGLTISQAEAINDLGQIAAYARYAGDNNEHLVLLTPVPEPTSLLALAACGGLLALRRRRCRGF